MARPRKIDETQVLALIALGESFSSIARQIGCHYTSVRAIAKRHEISADAVEKYQHDRAILAFYDAGERGIEKIAAAVGCSPRTVSYALGRMRAKKA